LPDAALARGPGNLCRALAIDRALDGTDLTRGPVVILDAPAIPRRAIVTTTRIGVAYAGADALRPWRFYVLGSPAVSAMRRGRAIRPLRS
jgi:DNA-3-methyladenine glycosylase